MVSIVATVAASIAATYIFFYFLLHLTQNEKEPPLLGTEIPFLSPVLGMLREKSRLYIRLRDSNDLPIYTLRLPFSRIYVVNHTDLTPSIQAQWRNISFAFFTANAGKQLALSQTAIEILQQGLTHTDSFSVSWPRAIQPCMAPGKDLDIMNRTAIEGIAAETNKLDKEEIVRIGLWQWSRDSIVRCSSEAVWGPHNPFRNSDIMEAWKTFESGFLTINIFPFASLFFPKILHARKLLISAMEDYLRKDGHKVASALVQTHYQHARDFGLGLEDIARAELGIAFAVLTNTAPCAQWFLYHILSDQEVLEDIRNEVSSLVRVDEDLGNGVKNFVDLSQVRTSCPILLSTFQETLRYRSLSPGVRMLLEDVLLDGRILLKKDSMLMIPAVVQHTNTSVWGENAAQFNHLRFTENHRLGGTAFRAFGGGHVLCPGRFFASTEVMAFAALLVLQFDIVPTEGRWVEPTWNNTPMQSGFPIPDNDIQVEFRPRGPRNAEWIVTFPDTHGETNVLDGIA